MSLEEVNLEKLFIVDSRMGASLVAQTVKRLPAMRETWIRFLGREDILEKEMTTHSSIPTWRIPWTEEPGGHSPWDCKSRTLLSD